MSKLKIALIGLACFLVTLSALTFVVARGRAQQTLAVAAHRDSAAGHDSLGAARRDSSHAAHAPGDSLTAPADSLAAHRALGDSTAAASSPGGALSPATPGLAAGVVAAPDSASQAPAVPAPVKSTITVEGAQRLAKMYSAMDTASSGRLLGLLTDTEAVAVLAAMKADVAARLLGTQTPERAAELSRRLMATR